MLSLVRRVNNSSQRIGRSSYIKSHSASIQASKAYVRSSDYFKSRSLSFNTKYNVGKPRSCILWTHNTRSIVEINKRNSSTSPSSSDTESVEFSFGNDATSKVSIEVFEPKHPELVPHLTGSWLEELFANQEILHHLSWMAQKDKLGQDIMLIGYL